MTTAYHPEALRQAIKDADREGVVFNVELLDSFFSGNLPRVANASYKHSGNGHFTINWVELSNGDTVAGDALPEWIRTEAEQLVKEHIKAKANSR